MANNEGDLMGDETSLEDFLEKVRRGQRARKFRRKQGRTANPAELAQRRSGPGEWVGSSIPTIMPPGALSVPTEADLRVFGGPGRLEEWQTPGTSQEAEVQQLQDRAASQAVPTGLGARFRAEKAKQRAAEAGPALSAEQQVEIREKGFVDIDGSRYVMIGREMKRLGPAPRVGDVGDETLGIQPRTNIR